MDELKPCPFCGEGSWHIQVGDTKKDFINPAIHFDQRAIFVQCMRCCATVGFYIPKRCGSVKKATANAIEAWNRRANYE